MPFLRRILHHGLDPGQTPQLLSLRAVRSCWFELHRQGGCGAGEIVLSDAFDLRQLVEIGDWISFEGTPGARWYLGRVEERLAESPARVRLRLQGMSVELNEIFPGGFGVEHDGRRPHRYAATDLFHHDPDRHGETFDSVSSADALVRKLMTQYGTAGHIAYDADRVEPPALPAPVQSLKLRGEESLRAVIKDLAVRAQSASWGVDAEGKFFFLRPRSTILATFREGRDLVSLEETRDAELLFNRLLLTGDYVYDRRDRSDDYARRSFRWRGNYFEPVSRSQHGDRRIRVWLPWVRTQGDAVAFAREFFRMYSQPVSRFLLETTAVDAAPMPWEGRIRLEDRHGAELITARIETVRVLFDHAPRLRMELGPEAPRDLWPEPPYDERWELGEQPGGRGGPVTYPETLPSDGGPGGTGPHSGDSSSSTTTATSEEPGSSDLFSSEPTSEAATSNEFPSDSPTSWGADSLTDSSAAVSSGAADSSLEDSDAASSGDSATSGVPPSEASFRDDSESVSSDTSESFSALSSGESLELSWTGGASETGDSLETSSDASSAAFSSLSAASTSGSGDSSAGSSESSGAFSSSRDVSGSTDDVESIVSSEAPDSAESSTGAESSAHQSGESDDSVETSSSEDASVGKSGDDSSSNTGASSASSSDDASSSEAASSDDDSSAGDSSEGITFVWS